MSKSSGSNRGGSSIPKGKRGGMQKGDENFKVTKKMLSSVEGLNKIKHADVYKGVKSAISRYEAVLGVRQRDVKLADLPSGWNGVHVTSNGQSSQILLSKERFNKPKKEIIAEVKSAYRSGWSTKTNKPLTHTVTHELAHATWNSHLTGKKYVAAGKEIKAVYDSWRKKKKRAGYGEYSHSNINEFFAESITKRVSGKKDKYNTKLLSIVQKYDL